MIHRRVAWNLHLVLTNILNTIAETPLGHAFKDRAVDVSTLKVLSDPVDHAAALGAYRYLLERADGDGLPLTTAGYLKPADVHPVLHLREYVKSIGLLRKHKSFEGHETRATCCERAV